MSCPFLLRRVTSIFDGQKKTSLHNFSPFWMGTLTAMMGNFKILAKALTIARTFSGRVGPQKLNLIGHNPACKIPLFTHFVPKGEPFGTWGGVHCIPHNPLPMGLD